MVGKPGTARSKATPVRVALSRFGWLATAAFLLNGNWEWLQTPFFVDSAESVNEIVWFRLHCTSGDVLILLGCAGAVSALRRSTTWLVTPRLGALVLLTVLGLAYTSCSELVNLARGAWAYSELMPLLPGTRIGITPMLQWLFLPSLAVLMTARLAGTR